MRNPPTGDTQIYLHDDDNKLAQKMGILDPYCVPPPERVDGDASGPAPTSKCSRQADIAIKCILVHVNIGRVDIDNSVCISPRRL